MNGSDRHECHLFGTGTVTLPELWTKCCRAQMSISRRMEKSDVWALSHGDFGWSEKKLHKETLFVEKVSMRDQT